MYSPQVLDHFEHPRNAGELPDATVTVTQENPACGDVIRLSLRVEGEKIVAARFQTKGCVTAIACSSALCEALEGMSVADAQRLPREQVVHMLGGLSNETMHASFLVCDALRVAIKQLSR